jgi:hypothetical protein
LKKCFATESFVVEGMMIYKDEEKVQTNFQLDKTINIEKDMFF